MKDWRENIHAVCTTEKEKTLCDDCGIKMRVKPLDIIIDIIEKYPEIKKLGHQGKYRFIFEYEKFNNLLGGDYFKIYDKITSFAANVVLAKLNNELPEDIPHAVK